MRPEELLSAAAVAKDGGRISCWIQPRASRSSIQGLHGQDLKIALAAPPVDGKANAALRKFIADKLELPKSSVEIVSGLTGRKKCVAVRGLSLQELAQRLAG